MNFRKTSYSGLAVCLIMSACALACARLHSFPRADATDASLQERPAIQWVKYYEALEISQKTRKRVVMIYFSHDPCKPCEMMEKWTFTDPKVVKAVNQLIPVRMEGDVEEQMAQRFKVQTYPMIVFARLDNGEIDRKAGYRDADYVLHWIEDVKTDRNTIQQVQKKLEETPNNVDSLFRQARNYLDADELEISREFARKAAEIDPKNLNALILKGLYHIREDELDDAATAVATALQIDGQNEEAQRLNNTIMLKKAERDLQSHAYAEAARQYLEILKGNPDHFSAHLGLGQTYREMGEVDKAFEELKKAEALRADSAVPHVVIGDLFKSAKNVPLAEEEYLKAIEVEPRYEPPYFRLMELYEENGRKTDLLGMLEKALPVAPAGARNEIAWLMATSKYPDIFDPVTAERHAQAAVEIDPDPMYLDTLAEAFYAQGKYDLAIGIIKEAIADGPDDLSYYQEQLNKFQKAKDGASKAP